MKIKKATLIRKTCLTDTLKSLELNVPFEFFDKDFKVQAIRKEAARLKKQGFLFEVSEKGRIGSCVVTRLR